MPQIMIQINEETNNYVLDCKKKQGIGKADVIVKMLQKFPKLLNEYNKQKEEIIELKKQVEGDKDESKGDNINTNKKS